ncbi:MAG: single-stranded-DNA-specific exonuclease RecJ [Clostridiales bacterium]|nr:single-stranded-DNA-specific exonuclease RecJ [Clostridiales bacterium]
MGRKKWVVGNVNKELAARYSEEYNIDPVAALLLVERGMQDEFIPAAGEAGMPELFDPFLMRDMEQAAARIHAALDAGERIAVFGDYDADGVSATALLVSFLESQGGDVLAYIPEREREGYGMNCAAVEQLAGQGVQLLITVDNGISALDEAACAAELGMDVIITDHHTPGPVLPRAAAVVNPHRTDCGAPFKELAGVGVAFKLACALYEGDAEELLADYGDLVAVGTIGDIVPLVGENRILVQYGLEVLNHGQRPGIHAFRQAANLMDRELSATDVAFLLVPRINAAGRMEHARPALELLLADDEDAALLRARQLQEYNQSRQATERQILQDIERQFAGTPQLLQGRVLVVAGEGYHPGVLGIVAAKLVERYGKPSIVLGYGAPDEKATGSCRSVEGFSIYDALEACSPCLTRFGGHPMAAGLQVERNRIEELRAAINEYARRTCPVMPVGELRLDFALSPAMLTLQMVDSLSVLEPFGAANSQPAFALLRMRLEQASAVGDGKHMRMTLFRDSRRYNAIYFGMEPARFPYEPGDIVDLAVKISRNTYNGVDSVSIQVQDMRLSGTKDDKFFEEKAVWELFCAGELVTAGQLKPLLPEKEQFAQVYRYLQKRGGYPYGQEHLYFRLQHLGISFGRLCIILQVFAELGLVKLDGDRIQLLQTQKKVDLESAGTMIALRSRTA